MPLLSLRFLVFKVEILTMNKNPPCILAYLSHFNFEIFLCYNHDHHLSTFYKEGKFRPRKYKGEKLLTLKLLSGINIIKIQFKIYYYMNRTD